MHERDIDHENGNYWVARQREAYTVFATGPTHSVSDSSYLDLSVAIARCDYLAKTSSPDIDARRFARLSAAT